MTVQLNDLWAALGGLAALSAVLGAVFAMLRYIIRAETVELRPNGGGSIKDAIHRIDEAAKATEAKLDEHIADSRARIARGSEVEAELRKALADVAQALPIVAASTPAAHEEG